MKKFAKFPLAPALSPALEEQGILANANPPYIFGGREQVEKELPVHYEWFKNYFKEIGAKKEDLK